MNPPPPGGRQTEILWLDLEEGLFEVGPTPPFANAEKINKLINKSYAIYRGKIEKITNSQYCYTCTVELRLALPACTFWLCEGCTGAMRLQKPWLAAKSIPLFQEGQWSLTSTSWVPLCQKCSKSSNKMCVLFALLQIVQCPSPSLTCSSWGKDQDLKTHSDAELQQEVGSTGCCWNRNSSSSSGSERKAPWGYI